MKNIITALALFFTLSFGSVSAADFDTRNSFAVVWTLETADEDLYKEAISDQSKQLLELWQEGKVENVYIDKDNTTVEKGKTGRVMFFIKAETEEKAKEILNEMPFAKKQVASYQLFPVGLLWLKQF